jgi:hypothetical protein
MRTYSRVLIGGLMALAAGQGVAQQRPTQSVPAPRALGPVVARTSQTFASVARLLTVRGAVFVQDPVARQLWMLDTSLRTGHAVLDSASGLGRENFYGAAAGPVVGSGTIHRFRGDSITYQMWVSTGPTSAELSPEALIIGPNGRVGRITNTPSNVGCPMGEVEHSGFFTCQLNLPLTWQPDLDMGDSVISRGRADSAGFLSVNFATWDVDTLRIRITTPPRTQMGFTYRTRPGARSSIEMPVLATADAWTTFRDGTLVIVRGADYHLEIIDVHGQVTTGPRAPFDWRRVTDADRERLLDSLRRADSVVQRRVDSVARATPVSTRPDGTVRPPPVRGVQPHAPPDEWSTYWPVLKGTLTGPRHSAVMVDEDDRIWVDERQPPGGDTISVYGIFNRKGEFLERVKVPASQTVRGFGPGGAVYLTTVDGGRTTVLMARFR